MSQKEVKRKAIECVVCKKIFSVPVKDGRIPEHCSDVCRHESCLISKRKYAKKKRLKEYKTEIRREVRSCPICGTSFTAEGKGYHRRYCSDKCASRQEHNLRNEKRIDNTPTSICPQCGKVFKKHRKKGTYCSQKCYTESLKAKEQTSTCQICGQEFNQRGHKLKYCSPLCSAQAQAEVYKRNTLTRRALRKTNGNVETINPKEIFDRDGWRCRLCGKKVAKRLYRTKGTKRYANAPSIDHIIPLSRGGQHTKVNVQCACYLCNCKKGARELGQLRLFG